MILLKEKNFENLLTFWREYGIIESWEGNQTKSQIKESEEKIMESFAMFVHAEENEENFITAEMWNEFYEGCEDAENAE